MERSTQINLWYLLLALLAVIWLRDVWVILVDRPDKVGRVQILKVHAGKVQLAPGLDLEQVAALTPGFPVRISRTS